MRRFFFALFAASLIALPAACGPVEKKGSDTVRIEDFDWGGERIADVPIESFYRDYRRHTRNLIPGRMMTASVSSCVAPLFTTSRTKTKIVHEHR